MSIQVECGGCGKQYSAPDKWAGEWAKCPKCGAKVEILTPLVDLEPAEPTVVLHAEVLDAGPTAADTMADLLAEELGAGPAAVEAISDPFAAMPAATAPVAPFRLAATPKRANSGGGSLKEFLLGHKLIAAVALMTCWVLLNQLFSLVSIGFSYGLLFGFGMVAVGVVIVLAGLQPRPTRRNRAADKRRAGQMVAWLVAGIVGIGMSLVAIVIGASMGIAVPTLANFSGPFITVFGIMVMVSGMVLAYYVLVLLFPRLNAFLIGACGFLGLTGLSVLISILALLVLSSGGSRSVDLGHPEEPFATKSVPLPGFAERGPPRTLMPGVNIEDVRLSVPGTGPGHYNRLQIFTPPGAHEAHSLPCVLIAPAGTNLISGCRLGNDADHPERIPYVLAGYAVVAYELDGEYPSQEPTNAQMRLAYQQFSAAQAGLVNARNALEYVLAKMPEVDPRRIYSAGHSSAATLAVLFAEHEPRLRACVAFAPVNDVTAHFGAEAALLRLYLPGAGDFFVKSSPKTHAANLGCPLFLFHAHDDSVVPLAETLAFAKTLEGLGKDVTLQTVSSGDHYDSMIEQGIPAAIEWLAGQGGAGVASPAQAPGTDIGSVRPPAWPSAERPMPVLPLGVPGVPGSPIVDPFNPALPVSHETELDQLLTTLRSHEASDSRLVIALSQLVQLEPIEARREEVAGLLDPLLTHSSAAVHGTALRAVGVWGTKRNVPALLGFLDDPSLVVKHPVIDAMKAIPDPRVLEALVGLVPDQMNGSTAARALQEMGPAAEEAVITLLWHEDYQVRYQACQVLKNIGGEKSIAALQELLQRDRHVWSRTATEIALRKLTGG